MTRLTHFALIGLVTGACIAPAFGKTTLASPATGVQPTSSATPAPAASSSNAGTEAFRIVTADQRKQWWVIADAKPPIYPKDAVLNRVQGCTAIALAIHANGTATPLEIVKKFWTVRNAAITKQLERLSVANAAQWRFKPARENASRTPIVTYAVIAFTTFNPDNAPTPADREPATKRMKAKCSVSNFAQDMQKLLGSPAKPSAAQ